MKIWSTYQKDFINYLRIERGLAENSIFAYQQDLDKLIDFCTIRNIAPNEVELQTLKDFINDLHELGLSARSQARVISGIKQFFDFLILENTIQNDPSSLLELPRISQKLPVFLTIEEIDQLQSAIDLSKPEGHRNKAIIETLY